MTESTTQVENSFSRDRPFGASRRSTASSKSMVSMNPAQTISENASSSLFCFRSGAIDRAVEHCKTGVVDSGLDGTVRGSWLLTEIDHWDMEREKLVLLTSKSVLIVHYDFIQLQIRNFRRIALGSVTRIEIGDLVYPAYSVMPARQHGGARIHWSTAGASFARNWNPFCPDVGYVTLSHHLLAYKPEERETVTFDVGDFIDSVTAGVHNLNSAVPVEKGPVTVESYASVASLVFNQSHIGFNMSRGGVSF